MSSFCNDFAYAKWLLSPLCILATPALKTSAISATPTLPVHQITPAPTHDISIPPECGSLCESCVSSWYSIWEARSQQSLMYNPDALSDPLCAGGVYGSCLESVTMRKSWYQFIDWIDSRCYTGDFSRAGYPDFAPAIQLLMPSYVPACTSSLALAGGRGNFYCEDSTASGFEETQWQSCYCKYLSTCTSTRTLRADILAMQYWSSIWCQLVTVGGWPR